ncbi:CHAP domain-containing protein [Amnibacterium flavum]|uniref:CHAP domain-containing protein n=1 Tax=Amnibacterium flavum TaxID=2173173 RepID=UPI001401D5F1|nr:CHAP domain-containing protein [Amnibacterium flavum]
MPETVGTPVASPLTRRELREAEQRREDESRRPRTTQAGARRVTVGRSAPGVRRSVPAASPRTAAPAPKRRTGPWRALVTVLVVPGLFATAALPAYAASVAEDGTVYAGAKTGQSLFVSANVSASTIDRGGLAATSDEEMAARLADPARTARTEEYEASGARELGDDYPWFAEEADVEGGGLSPLSYYYRECVDFVAWRLNRDAGVTQAPWKYTWFNLTPNGGDASQWASNWRSHGWPTGSEPVAGSVAWFNGNHVAYVKTVLDNGQIVIEEYNHGSTHKYGIRTIAATDVALFLYAPPR